MSKYQNVTALYSNNGGVEAMIGDRGTAIPITIDGARLGSSSAKVTVKGPSLFARRSSSPYKAIPFTNGSLIKDPTNTTNATIDVADADAVKFQVGDVCTFYDVSAGALDSQTKTISAIGAAGSGGAGQTTITFTGVWTTAPAGDDILVVKDGAEQSSNVVVVLEDIEFDGATDFASVGYLSGTFLKAKVNNTTYFKQSENQVLKLVDMQ